MVKGAAAELLRDLGAAAVPALAALEALEALAAHDPLDPVRKQAKEAVDRIRAGTPPSLEFQRLRDGLEKLRRQNDALADRVDRLERKQPSSGGLPPPVVRCQTPDDHTFGAR